MLTSHAGYYVFSLSLFQLISLVLDGLTGTIQDKLRSGHNISAYHMMYAVNAFAAVYLSVGVVSTGELWGVIGFIQRHPSVIFNIAIFSVASAIGQVSGWVGGSTRLIPAL